MRLARWALLVLLWTNPCDPDIAAVRIFATRPGAPADTLWLPDFPPYPDENAVSDPATFIYLQPCAPESLRTTLPPVEPKPDTWSFGCFVFDTSGNRSGLSNTPQWTGVTP